MRKSSVWMASLTAALNWRHVGHATPAVLTYLVTRRGYASCVRFERQVMWLHGKRGVEEGGHWAEKAVDVL
jgi:hypothetical protein